mmetsp:Transcript_38714/g.99000  ORF Transcript_38714/g.99000 Transcript_38714/m.99000 type:complete len:212 (-) Transcript_38714:378-1013(-)
MKFPSASRARRAPPLIPVTAGTARSTSSAASSAAGASRLTASASTSSASSAVFPASPTLLSQRTVRGTGRKGTRKRGSWRCSLGRSVAAAGSSCVEATCTGTTTDVSTCSTAHAASCATRSRHSRQMRAYPQSHTISAASLPSRKAASGGGHRSSASGTPRAIRPSRRSTSPSIRKEKQRSLASGNPSYSPYTATSGSRSLLAMVAAYSSA